MGDTNNTATPPAASGGLTKEDVAAIVKDAVTAAVTPLQQKIATLESATPPKAEDLVKQAKDQLAAEQAAAAQAKALSDKRAAAIAEKGKGIPAIYTEKVGPDETKWEAELTAARAAYQQDLAAAGIKAADVSSDPPAGKPGDTKPAEMVDLTKLDGAALIAMGVKQRAAMQDASASASADATAAAVAATTAPAAEAGDKK